MKTKVYRIISQIMEVPIGSISEDSSKNDLVKWDSLKHMDLMVTIEEEFGIRFRDDELVDLADVKSILKSVQEHTANL